MADHFIFAAKGDAPDDETAEVVEEAGLRSDGELVQAVSDPPLHEEPAFHFEPIHWDL